MDINELISTSIHSPYSPSSSYRWIKCPGSVNKEKKHQDFFNKSAIIGIILHKILNECLNLKNLDVINAYEGVTFYLGEFGNYTFTKKQSLLIKIFLSYFIDQIFVSHYKIFNEELIRYENLIPNGFGTVDSYLIQTKDQKKYLDVFDFKTGYVKSYSAFKNPQLLLYTIGIINKYKRNIFHRIRIHIVQPKRNNFIDSWEVDLKYLKEFKKNIKEIYKKSIEIPLVLVGGIEQCQYCKANKECKESIY